MRETHGRLILARMDKYRILSRPAGWLALSGGVGLVPFMPGTFGALAGIPLGFGLGAMPEAVALALLAVGFGAGIWACAVAGKMMGQEDPGAIVWDETWAMAALVWLVPEHALSGFVLFRLFDIWKPWPIRMMDARLKGGIGIMADDAVAACAAWAILMLPIPLPPA